MNSSTEGTASRTYDLNHAHSYASLTSDQLCVIHFTFMCDHQPMTLPPIHNLYSKKIIYLNQDENNNLY